MKPDENGPARVPACKPDENGPARVRYRCPVYFRDPETKWTEACQRERGHSGRCLNLRGEAITAREMSPEERDLVFGRR